MRRVLLLLMVSVTAIPMVALGGGILILKDPLDSYQSVRVAQMDTRVAGQGKALARFLVSFLPRTLPDVERVLGRPTGSSPDSTYAMPLCQTRLVGLGGLGKLQTGRNRVHAEFYPVDDVGGLQVWYEDDSTTVATSVAYLKVDSLFVPHNRQTQNELGSRLSWDRDRLALLEQALRRELGK